MAIWQGRSTLMIVSDVWPRKISYKTATESLCVAMVYKKPETKCTS